MTRSLQTPVSVLGGRPWWGNGTEHVVQRTVSPMDKRPLKVRRAPAWNWETLEAMTAGECAQDPAELTRTAAAAELAKTQHQKRRARTPATPLQRGQPQQQHQRPAAWVSVSLLHPGTSAQLLSSMSSGSTGHSANAAKGAASPGIWKGATPLIDATSAKDLNARASSCDEGNAKRQRLLEVDTLLTQFPDSRAGEHASSCAHLSSAAQVSNHGLDTEESGSLEGCASESELLADKDMAKVAAPTVALQENMKNKGLGDAPPPDEATVYLVIAQSVAEFSSTTNVPQAEAYEQSDGVDVDVARHKSAGAAIMETEDTTGASALPKNPNKNKQCTKGSKGAKVTKGARGARDASQRTEGLVIGVDASKPTSKHASTSHAAALPTPPTERSSEQGHSFRQELRASCTPAAPLVLAEMHASTDITTCAICCADVPAFRSVQLRCGHGWYCASCVLRYSESRLAVGKPDLPCPDCSAEVVEHEMRRLLPEEVVEAFLSRSLEVAVCMNADLRPCPTPGCPMRVALSEDGTNRFKCPLCNKTCCAKCGWQPFHAGLTCAERAAQPYKKERKRNQATGSGDSQKATGPVIISTAQVDEGLLQWMTNNGAKQCPCCRSAVTKQRLQGQHTQRWECHKMICRACGTRFCFKCLTVLTASASCGCTSAEHGFVDPHTGKVVGHSRKQQGKQNQQKQQQLKRCKRQR